MEHRLQSLDVFRGLTVAGMLLVNQPGDWGAIYPPLEHAAWNGWTPTDLIFPFFLFIVGVTTHLSVEARRRRGDSERQILGQLVKRSLLIVLCGLLLASFPWWPLERITGMRFPGVLQRIGVAYFFGALLTLGGSLKRQVVILVCLLFGYWFAMTLLPVPGSGAMGQLVLDDPSASLAAWLDRAVFGRHLWKSSVTWDPEGLLSTVPAIGTVMLGVFSGRWISIARPIHEKLVGLFGAGALATVGGLMWNWSFPINKNLWTSSYVLLTSGMAAMILGVAHATLDTTSARTHVLLRPLIVLGRNALVLFVLSGWLVKTLIWIKIGSADGSQTSLYNWIFQHGFAPWASPKNASLLFALAALLVLYAVLELLYRRRWFLRA